VRRRSGEFFPIAVDVGGDRVYITLIDAAACTGHGAERFPGLPGWVHGTSGALLFDK
jgi:ribosomal protein L21E